MNQNNFNHNYNKNMFIYHYNQVVLHHHASMYYYDQTINNNYTNKQKYKNKKSNNIYKHNNQIINNKPFHNNILNNNINNNNNNNILNGEIILNNNKLLNGEIIFDNNYNESKLHTYLKLKLYKELVVKVENIQDLIDIANNNEYNDNYTYNVNLEGLHKIKEDLIQLNNLIGLQKIKKSIFDQIIYFIQDINQKENDFKHTVIYGPPGTGKTLIAKILGNIYSKIGILKNNYFHSVSRGDLVAGYLGQTAIKTKQVIKDALGGVLFIDEAYALGGDNTDNFSKECLDTLCHELSEHKEDLMVIIAGYEKELNDYFFSKNKGLNSRFIWRFSIDSYTYDELMHIFVKKINDIGWKLDDNINSEWFKNKMCYFTNYGRDMEILLFKTKIIHCKRVFGKPTLIKKITLEDLNNGFDLFKENPEVKKRNEKVELPSFYC